MSDDEKYNSISDYIIFMKEDKKLSSGSIKANFNTIKKFFKVNNISLQWDQLNGFKGKSNGKLIDDRVYTKEEILKMLDHADLRMKVVILVLLSSGMRIGGLAELKVKDLEYIQEYNIYKITVYSYDKNEKYVTFCSPECADHIKKYLRYRESIGDTVKPESPLIYRKIARVGNKGKGKERVKITDMFDEHVTSHSLQEAVARLQRKSMVVSIEKHENHSEGGRVRKEMMRCHAFRKIFNSTCIENNVNHYVKEKLLGHKATLGLDVNYMRDNLFNNTQQDKLLLDEYLKVVDALTVNDENRLKNQNERLKERIARTNNEIADIRELLVTMAKDSNFPIDEFNKKFGTDF
jgi:integrase